MLVIPIGKDQGEVRRQPWVSYAIIAANVVVFAFLWLASTQSDVPEKFEAKAKEITQYLVANPHLTIPEGLVPLYGHQAVALLAQVRAGSSPPIDWVARRQQQKLNAMADELFAISRELPILKPGFIPADPLPLSALSSLFVHAGLIHLLGNMLFFFATGPFLEDVYGRVVFTILYLASGVAALAAHTWQNPGSWAPVIGASGAVAGIMGAFLLRLGASRIRFLIVPIVFIPWIRFRALVPAFVFLPLWFIGQFWLATNINEPGGIALWAHVGGFAFGAVAALLIAALGIEKRWIHPAIERRVSWTQDAGVVDALEARGKGNVREARRIVESALRQKPSNVDAQRLACDLALEQSDWTAFGREAARLFDLYVANGEKELALALLEEATAQASDGLPLRFLQRAATFLDKNGEERWAIQFYRQIAERHATDPGSLRALLRLAELLQKEGDPAGARNALALAQKHPECAGDWRPLVEGRISGRSVSAT